MAENKLPTESEPLLGEGISSHENRGGNTTNWWSYESLTIGEVAALHNGMHPKFAFSSRCGPLQRAVMAGSIQRLIGAVMTGSIRTIERYDSSNKTEITCDTAIITKDALIFLVRISGKQETGSQQTTSGKELSETERNTLLKLIIGMAIDAYGYNPESSRNSASGDNKNSISAKLALKGIAITDDTIRKYLNEAKNIL